ncbi:MAG: glycosyltransferase [Ferruginibacter sp.]|nr:glycosyltransferase [Cytophagales bacterium]
MKNTGNKAPLFSIITVAYNDAVNLEKTIQNVLSQTCGDFEYVIVDGGSKDGSVDVIKKYEDRIDLWVSEKDKGICDAMNKGVLLAKGEYINFMNAGDSFYDARVLDNVREALLAEKVDILYGKVMKQSSEKSELHYESGGEMSPQSFFMSIPICHQAAFAKRSLFSTLGLFDEKFPVAFDYAWFARYYHATQSFKKFRFIDKIIANYLDGGNSFIKKNQTDRERLAIAKKYFSRYYLMLNYLKFPLESLKTLVLPWMVKHELLDRYREIRYKSKVKT